MTFNRGKFKPASLQSNKELGEKTESLTKSQSGNKRTDFLTIEEGTNVFRICPPHDEKDPSIEAKCVTWLPRKVDALDKEGNPTGKKEIKDRPVFNSRVHGGTPKDIVDEYINFAYKLVYDEVQDKDERSKRMSPISGWRDKSGKWNPGIKFSTGYIMYAFKNSTLGRLELWKGDKDRMEELNISEEAEDPISTDIFSDPNEGVSLIITKKKDAKGNWEKIISKREYNPKKHKTWDEFIQSERLTDEQLMELDKQPSLRSLYRDCYTRKDFNLALEGLKIFDDKNDFKVFENEDFLKVCEEIDGYYPELSEEGDDVDKALKGGGSISERLNKMDRTALKVFIKEKSLSITVMKSWSEDDIRDAIIDALNKLSQPEVEETEEEAEEEDEDTSGLPPSEDLGPDPEEKATKKYANPDITEPIQSVEERVDKQKAVNDKLAEMKARLSKKK